MNASGYLDPTAEQAVSRIERHNRLCKKHNVVIGKMYKISVMRGDAIYTKPKKSILKVKVVDVYNKFVVIEINKCYTETMFWDDFHNARCLI